MHFHLLKIPVQPRFPLSSFKGAHTHDSSSLSQFFSLIHQNSVDPPLLRYTVGVYLWCPVCICFLEPVCFTQCKVFVLSMSLPCFPFILINVTCQLSGQSTALVLCQVYGKCQRLRGFVFPWLSLHLPWRAFLKRLFMVTGLCLVPTTVNTSIIHWHRHYYLPFVCVVVCLCVERQLTQQV